MVKIWVNNKTKTWIHCATYVRIYLHIKIQLLYLDYTFETTWKYETTAHVELVAKIADIYKATCKTEQ